MIKIKLYVLIQNTTIKKKEPQQEKGDFLLRSERSQLEKSLSQYKEKKTLGK